MAYLSLTMSLDNAAFEGGQRRHECARLLRAVADCVERGDADGPIFDLNGNRTGDWEISGEDEPDCCAAPDLDENGRCNNCGEQAP